MIYKSKLTVVMVALLVCTAGIATFDCANADAKAPRKAQAAKQVEPEYSEEGSAPAAEESEAATAEDYDAQRSEESDSRRSAEREPVSLLGMLWGSMGIWVGVLLLIGLLMTGNVLLCSAVWHITKMFRGGRRPEIG